MRQFTKGFFYNIENIFSKKIIITQGSNTWYGILHLEALIFSVLVFHISVGNFKTL